MTSMNCFDKFHEKVVNVIDNIAPYESFRPGKYSFHKEVWLPCSLLKCIKKQKVLYKNTLKPNSTESDHLRYKQYRNTLTKIKRNCKCTHYQDKCYEFRSNTKVLWKVINTITGNLKDKSCIVSELCENGISYNSPRKIVNIFNNHFSSVGREYAKAIKASKQNQFHVQFIL